MKYSKVQLSQMADVYIEAKKAGDPRALHLELTMMLHTGLSSEQVNEKIKAMANG